MALMDDVRDLTRNPTLRDLEPEALRLIAFSAETRILRAGDILFRQGDISDGGYVVISGSIALESDGPVTIARAPMLLGDTALITETRRPATALAREPSSVLKISRSLFHRVLNEYPDSAVRLRRSLANRLDRLGQDLDMVRITSFEA
jgi:CRP-like cAMP-binding protein